jgi:5-methylcytosine-specific restriction enzyme A
MAKITVQMITNSFDIGKRFYDGNISLTNGIGILTNMGMNEHSARYYIYNVGYLIEGKSFTRTMSIDAITYYLNKIHSTYGTDGFLNALHSITKHIEYYQKKSNSPCKALTTHCEGLLKGMKGNSSHTPSQVKSIGDLLCSINHSKRFKKAP